MSTTNTEAIGVNYCRDGCRCKEFCLPVIPPFLSSGDAKIGKEDINGSFGVMILWNDVRRLVFETAES